MTDTPETPNDEGNAEETRTPFEDFLFHQRRALEETGKALEALLPEGFRTHGSNAGKEFTEGFRVLIDSAMKELKRAKTAAPDDENDEPDASSTGKNKVKIPVD